MRKTFEVVKTIAILLAALTVYVWASGKIIDVLLDLIIRLWNAATKK